MSKNQTFPATGNQPGLRDTQENQDLIHNAPVGVFKTTPDGKYLFANPALARMYGYDSPEELMTAVTDIGAQMYVDPWDREEFKRLVESEGQAINHESRLYRRDGSVFWASRNACAVWDEWGNISHYQGFTSEITERKQAEDKLRYQHRLLEAIIEGTRDILAIQYPDHSIEHINQAGSDLLGFRPEEVKGFKCYELIGRHHECPHCATRQVLQSKQPADMDLFIPELGMYLNCRSSPILDEQGNISRIVEQLRDISEQKRYEYALKNERDYLFRLFDTMSQYVFVCSSDYRIEFSNRSARNMFGDLEGKTCYKQLYINTRCPNCPLNQKQATEITEPVGYTIEIFGRILEGTATRLVNPDGSFSVLEVCEDVTDRIHAEREKKTSEAQLRALVDTLPDLVWLKDRKGVYLKCNQRFEHFCGAKEADIIGKTDYDLVNKDLADFFRAKDKAAMDAGKPCMNEEEITFAEDGHKEILETIKTPFFDFDGKLIGVLGIGRDITSRKKTEKLLRESEETYRNLFHNAQVGIFRTRIDDGKIIESNDQLARMFGYTNREDIIDNYLTSENYVDPGTRERMVNEIQTKGEIHNFEARFYRRDGSIFWALYSARIYPEQGWIEGVAEDITELKETEKEKLQAQKTAIEHEKYIEQHKGSISVESQTGQGTQVTISLPVIHKELLPREMIEIKQTAFHLNKYILLVEDEQAISDVQYRILTNEPCKHKVDIAHNGRMAIDLFKRNAYDLVSLDYVLPGETTGMDVYRSIRKTNADIPILFISGNLEFLESIKDLQSKDPHVDHVSKPCPQKDYIQAIDKLFMSQAY